MDAEKLIGRLETKVPQKPMTKAQWAAMTKYILGKK